MEDKTRYQGPVPEQRDDARDDNHGGELRDGRCGIPFVLVTMHQVNAVVDPDSDESDDRKHREQVERHAGKASRPAVQMSPMAVGSAERADSRQSRNDSPIRIRTMIDPMISPRAN